MKRFREIGVVAAAKIWVVILAVGMIFSRGVWAEGSISDEALTALRDAVAHDEYVRATELVDGMMKGAGAEKSSSPIIVAKLFEARVRELKSLYDNLSASRKRLDSEDRGANAAVGKFYLLGKRDAARAVGYLAKGDDKKLAEIADMVNAAPAEAERNLAIADQMWTLAAKEKGIYQANALWISQRCYERAYPQLEGETKKRAGSRIVEMINSRIDSNLIVREDAGELLMALDAIGLDTAFGVKMGKLAPIKQNLTYFHIDAPFENQSGRGVIDKGFMVAGRMYCVDGDKKANVFAYEKPITINQKGKSMVDIGAGTQDAMRKRNNNSALPTNGHLAFKVGEVIIFETFLSKPVGQPWWLDDSLIRK